MRLPLVAAGVIAVIAFAVPVQADPAGDDARFLAALNRSCGGLGGWIRG
ncbi:MAG: hypothetical protein QJR12_09435 [Mycobacterium sp.]|nr:hypothetical protein [Mycobacterium sp.]MDI3314482.1 hypothetical protein [Mycobacterium sp.]